MWKVLNKEVDLGEPTSFLDHVYLGCTQRQCEISKDIVDNYRTMFESRISAGGVLVESRTHSARSWFSRTSWHCIFEREQVRPCNRRGEHRLQHLRRAERDGETITWHQRSQLDSADRKSPSTRSTTKWSSTTSCVQSLQQRVKRCDYGCWEHWIMRDNQRGAEVTMQGMS